MNAQQKYARSKWAGYETGSMYKEKGISTQDKIQLTILPILDQPHLGLTTFNAKDLDHLIMAEERLHIAMVIQ